MDIQRGKKLVEMALARQPQEDEGTENQINTLDNASIVDDPVPSTSSDHVINVMSRAEIDFSSDDSVQDPHYQLPRMTPSSDSEESTEQHTVSPKKSVRILKREKKMKLPAIPAAAAAAPAAVHPLGCRERDVLAPPDASSYASLGIHSMETFSLRLKD
ncbi:hypothetical protein PYW08_011477 [Mythimna loreyi]|uniref:Uncharacterized protein n=1 Tax=Mythimna loreyi TaxID=667449 RepID=A0ACC2QLM3_9NEOP|nr:hypothetical protein PYW08_011477 [Mythimna loreyi]